MFKIKYSIRDVIDDWIIAIRKNIGDDRFLAELSGNLWAQYLTAFPGDADKCPWEKLSRDNWETLLSEQRHLAQFCPHPDWLREIRPAPLLKKEDFAGFSDWQWTKLLLYHPVYIDICPEEKISWVYLLQWHPEFAARCPWEKVSDHCNWGRVLEKQPQLAKYCPWHRLTGTVWAQLLLTRPEFAGHCDFGKFSANDWIALLTEAPQWHTFCEVEKLSGSDAARLFSAIARACHRDFKEARGNLCELQYQQQMTEKRREALEHIARVWPEAPARWRENVPSWAGRGEVVLNSPGYLLAMAPELFPLYRPEWLTGDDWSLFLARHPEYAAQCDWESFSGRNWCDLLKSQPQMAEHCDWDRLTPEQWPELLIRHPEFLRYCPESKRRKWTEKDWRRLIAAGCEEESGKGKACRERLRKFYSLVHADREELARQIDWNGLSAEDMLHAVALHPEFADRIDWEKILKDRPGWAVADFFRNCPPAVDQFLARMPHRMNECAAALIPCPGFDAERLNFRKLSPEAWEELLFYRYDVFERHKSECRLTCINENRWPVILERHPELAPLCPWHKLPTYCLEKIYNERFPLLHACNWARCKKLTVKLRLNLLITLPEYEPFCDPVNFWGEDLALLLTIRPEFAKICDLSTLPESDIATLVARQPRLLKLLPPPEA